MKRREGEESLTLLSVMRVLIDLHGRHVPPTTDPCSTPLLQLPNGQRPIQGMGQGGLGAPLPVPTSWFLMGDTILFVGMDGAKE